MRTLLISLLLLLSPCGAWAGSRVALLIGEGDYFRPPPTVHGYFWPKLANPPHDVTLVAQQLKADGFDTTVAIDAGREDLEKKIADFAAKAAKADDAVVYYAGHGFEYARHNYLVPIDAPAGVDLGKLDTAYIDLDEVERAASKARRVNIFFLDACRTKDSQLQLTGQAKPYVDDVEFQPGTPVAVFYSTGRGEEAFDHAESTPPPESYSPFAWYVAQFVTLPRTSLGDFFTFVNAKVQQSTKSWGPQSPYMLSSLTELYYFRPAGAVSPPPPLDTTGPAPTSPVGKPGRGLPAPLALSPDYLARTDEPVVVADVLADHSPDDIIALAESGDPLASYLLGYMFEFGHGVQPDLAQARTWLTQAAVSNLEPAQLELGYFLEHHASEPGDAQTARLMIEAAAGKGFAKAQAHLADLLMNDGVYADYAKGLELYRASARQDYPQALYALAYLKDAGARARLAELAAGGDMASHQWLCELAAGDGSVLAGLADCLAAAKAGYSLSQARLAIAYHDGAGAPANPDEARHWLRLALGQPDLRPDLLARLQALGG